MTRLTFELKKKKKKVVIEVIEELIVEYAIEKMQNICVRIVGNQDVELQKLKKAKNKNFMENH
jgi:phosphotransferase system IIB component